MPFGAPVDTSSGPPPIAFTKIFDYSGGSSIVYIGYALSDQGKATQLPAITGITNANPGVITWASAPGFDIQGATVTSLPVIAISGGTGSWTAINGVWVYQPASGSTTTGTLLNPSTGVQLDTTAFGAVTGTLVAYTRAPLTSAKCWAISKNVNSAGGAVLFTSWGALPGGPAGAGDPAPGDPSHLVAGSVGFNLVWANRANYSYS